MAIHLLALTVLLSAPASAQNQATLLADSISVDPQGIIIAEGNVEVFHEETRLTATRVIYDQRANQLNITGPIVVTDSDGSVFAAQSATLDSSLRDGILQSARLVLNRQLQLAANDISRIDGRYTALNNTVASACRVCSDNQTPLWEIRASRVVHDNQEQQLYFESAQLRFVGVPVFYIPRLRLPDPTLERTSGFLIPRLRTSSDLGTGLKLPYFYAIGQHADLTVTPYLSASTETLEFGYRQEIRNGQLSFDGAFSNDDIDSDRGYVFATGQYQLPKDFRLSGQLELVSDPGYLYLYNYSDKDRLTNSISVDRVREKDVFSFSVSEFRTLRESEIPIRDTLTDRFLETRYRRKLPNLVFGGQTDVFVSAVTLNRPSSADIDGRDVSRVGIGAEWKRSFLFSHGIVAKTELGAQADAYNIGQDSNFESNLIRTVPRGALELRLPMIRNNSDGSSDLLEPILRLDIADASGGLVPLEDSNIVEFDEANLFSFSRYPGVDGVENGARLAAGLNWKRRTAQNTTYDLALGRVASLDGSLGFAAGTGLTGDQSEWLVAGRMQMNSNLAIASRSLFDDNVAVTLSETRIDWASQTASVGSSYIFAAPEPAEGRLERLSEWSFDGSLAITENWTASTDWRYDFRAGRAAKAGLGLNFTNECVEIDLSVSRRYATSSSVTPTTDFGFRISLNGVGGASAGPTNKHTCSG